MTRVADQLEVCMLAEPQPFDAWLTAVLRQRFGEPEQLSEDWVALIDQVRCDD